MLQYILLSTVLISSISLVAVLFLAFKEKLLKAATHYFVALSAGTMMGTAYLHLIPELSETLPLENLLLIILLAFGLFFIVEKSIHWHHSHSDDDKVTSIGYMNLIGDGIHNFIDGVLLAATFAVDVKLGILASFAVALHELPQEIGDFGVLLHAGWSKWEAIKSNLIVSMTMILGGIVGFYLFNILEGTLLYLTAVAAGGFIYIASSDLIPELKEEKRIIKSISHLLVFGLGVLITYLL
ncbi:ZIP family metal transporter [Candidatus Dojkabacteria bacterium]|nr:ZIP family metal transporter [Candidatus Dojkabacteria bacterium]